MLSSPKQGKKEVELKELKWPAWLDESGTDEDVEFPKVG